MARFYAIEVLPDLFGRWIVERRWGRIGSNGASLRQSFADPSEARRTESYWRERKLRGGYRDPRSSKIASDAIGLDAARLRIEDSLQRGELTRQDTPCSAEQ